MKHATPRDADNQGLPRAWVRLHESPFEGEWVGLTRDFYDALPCSRRELGWLRLWVAIQSPNESRLASSLFERLHEEGLFCE